MYANTSTLETPIFKLSYDTLLQIFSANTGLGGARFFTSNGELSGDGVNSLTATRRASQVCRTWRGILVESPSVWARCINLDEMAQQDGHWRELVLQRTGQSKLYVTLLGRKRMSVSSAQFEFFVNLLDNHWSRIRELAVKMAFSDLDNTRMWDVLRRPAENLQLFDVRTHAYDAILENEHRPRHRPASFCLFSNHAPALAYLSVSSMFSPSIATTEININRNLKHLRLHRMPEIKPADLLSACLHMPLLEMLDLRIAFISTASPEIDSIRPIMLRLSEINIISTSLDIYHVFLDHIVTAAGCALHARHTQIGRPAIGPTPADSAERTYTAMQRIIERFAGSAIDQLRPTEGAIDTQMQVDIDTFALGCCRKRVTIHIAFNKRSAVGVRLLDVAAALSFLGSVTQLGVAMKTQIFDDSPSFPPLRALLQSMYGATVLIASPGALFHLACVAQREVLFPALKVVSVRQYSLYQEPEGCIMEFLGQRHQIAPLEVLMLDIDHTKAQFTDLRFLDDFAGLKVVWSDAGGVKNEYICGSGNVDRLWLYREYSMSGTVA